MTDVLTFDFETDALHHIPVDLIDALPQNRPGDVGDTADIDESIRAIGVQQAIRVRPSGDGRFTIIYGWRRWLSSVKVGRPTIPAIIDTSATDPVALVEKRLIENLRKPLHPLDEGALFDELITLGRKEKEIALLLGDKSQPFVSERVKIHRGLTDDAKAVFRDGLLKVKDALALCELRNHPDLIAEVLDLARADGDVDTRLRYAVRDARRLDTIAAKRAELEAAGVPVRRNGMHKGEEVLGAAYGVLIEPDAHCFEPCHEAMILTDGAVEYLCNDRDRHRPSGDSELKAPNLTDDGDDDGDEIARFVDDVERAGIRAQDDDDGDGFRSQDEIADAETAKRDAHAAAIRAKQDEANAERDRARAERKAAADERLLRARAVVAGTRSSTVALRMLTDQIAQDNALETMRVELADVLDIDIAGLTFDEQCDRIRGYAFTSDDARIRWAAAVAYALGEVRLSDAGSYDDDQTIVGARAHLTLLVDHGYTPTAAELDILDPTHGAEPDPTDATGVSPGDAPDPEPTPAPDAGAAFELSARVDHLLNAAQALRAERKKSKAWDERLVELATAKGDVIDAITAHVADADAFAAELRSIDDASFNRFTTRGPVKTDEDLAEYQASQERLVQAFVDAGVPLTHEVADLIRTSHVVRFSWGNDGMPDWIRTCDIVDALDVEIVPFASDVARHAATAPSTEPAAPVAADAMSPGELPRAVCSTCGTDTALRKGNLYREHRNADGEKCPASGQLHEPGESDEPRSYDLTRPRVTALAVVWWGELAGVDVRESNVTTSLDALAVTGSPTVYWQSSKWLVDEGLADVDPNDDGARILGLTAEGVRVAKDEDVLAGVELPAPVSS